MIGKDLGAYRILDKLGEGGMGEVYRARDTRLGRTVAIKVLAATVAGDGERRERFLQEARATAALSHPNISALYEIGDEDGQLYLVFEFVPGETLTGAIAGRPLNPRRALDLSIQMADAIADAHAAGIVHRDIKPDNIIVTPKGHAKILDFGLATWTSSGIEREQAATVVATAAGTTLGTVAYLSPEQALGEAVDGRTDIFSLGIVLFEMLTGRLPFKGATSTALALEIVQAAPPAPSSVNPSVPRELDPIVAKALAKSLDHRYESAATMAAELRAVAAILDVRSHRIQPPSSTITILPRRRSYGRAIAVAVLVAVASAVAWYEREPIRSQWRRMFGRAPAPLIAVIPLQLPENDASQLYFADGLTEDLISRLGQTPGLRVLGRSATRGYRNRQPRDVAQELGADVVLTGSVRPSADNVKISLELIDPLDGTAIWSSQYTRDVQDIFRVQAQIAEEVATALRVKLQPSAASARTASRLVDPTAYEQYLRARQAMDGRRIPDAISLYRDAITADAGLAEAHAGLAEAIHLDMLLSSRTPERIEQLKSAAERAIQLDPDLPQANIAMGFTAPTLRETLQYMRHAVDVDPSYSDGYHQIADQIALFDLERSIGFYRKSLAIDAAYDMNRVDLLGVLRATDRGDEARREAAAIRGEGFADLKTVNVALIDLEAHQIDAALRALETNPRLRHNEPAWALYVVALVAAGRTDDALREATAALSKFREACVFRALTAGLRLKRGQSAAARQLAEPTLRAAASDAATAQDARCAVTMAFAINDSAQAAALLDRIGAREDWLRYWGLPMDGVSGTDLLRGRTYPSAGFVNDPAIVAAKARLEAANARERVVARTVLTGLP